MNGNYEIEQKPALIWVNWLFSSLYRPMLINPNPCYTCPDQAKPDRQQLLQAGTGTRAIHVFQSYRGISSSSNTGGRCFQMGYKYAEMTDTKTALAEKRQKKGAKRK